jgi:hypothetical protein
MRFPRASIHKDQYSVTRLARRHALYGFLEKVRNLVTSSLGVVDGDLAGFLGLLGDVFAGIFSGMVGQAKGLLGPIRRFEGDRFCAAIEVGDSTLGSLQASVAETVDSLSGLPASLGGIVHNHVTAFLSPVEQLFRRRARHLRRLASGSRRQTARDGHLAWIRPDELC